MIRIGLTTLAVLLSLIGCTEEDRAEVPPPFALTEEALGRYCGMNVLEHPGPKAQVILDHILEPIWFSSARDAIVFTMLPEEPKNIAAIYVSDMGNAESWKHPGAENWVHAHQAFYVIESSRRGGMGMAETVPFALEEDAKRFSNDHGGEVVTFDEIPAEYVIGNDQPVEGEREEQESLQLMQ